MSFEDAKKYIKEINEKQFAGFNDWRFPTLEEAMSLMEKNQLNPNDLYIDTKFDRTQIWIWTSDRYENPLAAGEYIVHFNLGYCFFRMYYSIYLYYVRAVRSAQSS